ncbi:MAG: hypothetical protein VX202_05825 [Pseudomonadota bacterium]|nr:hypothetical protein [Pseudomonadota bacterium]
MRKLATLITAGITVSGPAFAHSGMHLHPHGIDAAMVALVGSVFAVAGTMVAIKVRSK